MKLKYRPEIDGLRAIAVLPVILFHAGFSAFSGGFVGVDVFFAISGFLITSVIVGDVAAGTFSFLGFYERRARRILPALLAMMAVCIPFAWLWMFPSDLRAFSSSIVSVCAFASNILFWQNGGYFDTAAELKPLLHTWSLAVEEQYYILFPIAILVMWRFGRNRLIYTLALVALFSLLLSEWGWRYTPSANFYLLPTRAWEILVGSLCSFFQPKPQVTRDNVLSAAGLAAIVFSVFWFDETTLFPSIYAAIPVAGTCLVLLFANSGTIARTILSTRALVGMGLISYSAYLWHQPLFAFARIRLLNNPSDSLMLLLSAGSIALAYVSWRFVELPWRSRRAGATQSRRVLVVFAMLAIALLCSFGLSGFLASGFPQRLPDSVARLARYSFDGNPRIEECLATPTRFIAPAASCIYGTGKIADIALVGNSHATAIAQELGAQISEYGHLMRELSFSSCLPLIDYGPYVINGSRYECTPYNNMAKSYLLKNPNIKTVIIVTRFTESGFETTSFDNGEGGVEHKIDMDPTTPVGGKAVDRSERAKQIGKEFRQAISEITGAGKRVVLVYPIPEVGWDVPRYLAKAQWFGYDVSRPLSTSYPVFKQRVSSTYRELDAIAADENLLRIKPETVFCNTAIPDRCVAEDVKLGPYYGDDDHLDSIGAAMISRQIIAAMRLKGWI